jgi:hypothetical protein
MTIAFLVLAATLGQGPAGGSLRPAFDLLTAVKLGEVGRVRELVAGGAPVDATDRRGFTPLMWAAAGGSLELTTYLLENGARVDWRAHDGATALYCAAANGAIDVVKLLLGRGADPSTARAGTTPRQAALARGHADLAGLLEQAEARGSRNGGAQGGAFRASMPPPAPAIPGTLDRIRVLLDRIPAAAGAAGDAHRRAASALSGLQTLAAKWPAESPEDYRGSLADVAAALEEAIGRKDPEPVGAVLAAVADDLEAKLEHCQRSGGKLGGSVVVRVRTVQAGAEAGRWQVFYMPKILEVSPSATGDLFPQLSSPTEDLLVPGRYLMWVRNPGTGTIGERTVVKVGEGRKELVVDLPVPAAPAK